MPVDDDGAGGEVPLFLDPLQVDLVERVDQQAEQLDDRKAGQQDQDRAAGEAPGPERKVSTALHGG